MLLSPLVPGKSGYVSVDIKTGIIFPTAVVFHTGAVAFGQHKEELVGREESKSFVVSYLDRTDTVGCQFSFFADGDDLTEWAQKHDIPVVRTPVGFKEIAAVERNVEKAMSEHPGEVVAVYDELGNKIVIGPTMGMLASTLS